MKRLLALALLSGIGLMADTIQFSIDSSTLNLGTTGSYYFQLTSFTDNTSTISSGSPAILLQDNQGLFFQDALSDFTPTGGILSFVLNLSYLVDPSGTPDNLSFYLLADGVPLFTGDPFGGNAAFTVDLDGLGNLEVYDVEGITPTASYTLSGGGGVGPSPVPEPSNAWLALTVVGLAAVVRKRRRVSA